VFGERRQRAGSILDTWPSAVARSVMTVLMFVPSAKESKFVAVIALRGRRRIHVLEFNMTLS
jgi:hypothetical protein